MARSSPTHFHSPLRYPGGKRKLANFIKLLFRANDLMGAEYAEVFAGGAAVALSLLYGGYARRIHINDIDPGVYAFWTAAKNQTEELCRAIDQVPVNITEWERQRAVQHADEASTLDLALSTFYLNRTNRSGIITGGVIGGKRQEGNWKLDVRFNKSDLIRRIEQVGQHRSQIEIYNEDGAAFLSRVASSLPASSLLYLDPPYFIKGQEMLYANYYGTKDHALVSQLISDHDGHWIVSYDDVEEIRVLYKPCRSISYDIAYSAQNKYRGKEVIFFSPALRIPAIGNPAALRKRDLKQAEYNSYIPTIDIPKGRDGSEL